MKFLIVFIAFATLLLASPPRILQILRILSPVCSNNGYLYKSRCYCISIYTGADCSQRKGEETSDNAVDKCDDLVVRLDNLNNISPDFYLFDDDEFPRITNDSSKGWTRMHDISSKFHIFSNDTSALDIGQGGLGDCYLLAAFASLANRNNGSVLKNMFVDVNDNPKHVYTTRWLINGKPRFIAVDDWVPGAGSGSAFSHITADQDFWPLILEKSYAKIHGSYSIIEGGWQTAVWGGISLARTFDIWHSSINATTLFDKLVTLFKQNFAVGTATIYNTANNEVGGHAYSVLGAYEITTDNGTKVKLIRYFNPWHVEVWNTNPWGDSSANWTNYTKSQVPYLKGNDGIVYSTVEDFYVNFGVTNWAEIHDDYDVSFIDVAFNYDDLANHYFEVNFTYFGDAGNDLYIFNDQSDGRLLLGCNSAVSISSLVVIFQNGTVYRAGGDTLKISNAPKGSYKATFYMKKNQNYVKYFTLTSYSQAGKLNFVPLANNEILDYKEKECPNNCNLQGRCNTFDGTCKCYFGYEGTDCGKIRQKNCTSCDFGVCDQIFGVCILPGLFNLGTQSFLTQGAQYLEVSNKSQQWELLPTGHIHDVTLNKYMDVASLTQKTVLTWGQNLPYSNNQLWNISYLSNNRFMIKTRLNTNFSLSTSSKSSVVGLNASNQSDVFQQWSFKASAPSCPGNCNGHGVCSYTTGQCVCGTGYVGDACNITEAPLRCELNCSNHGACNVKTGYCNCQKEYVGGACDILYQDLICPINCSNVGVCSFDKGKCVCPSKFNGTSCENFVGAALATFKNVNNKLYLAVDAKNNLIFSNATIIWNITSDNHIILPNNGKCLDLAGSSVIMYGVNTPVSSNQLWVIKKVNNYYFISSKSNSAFALTMSADGKTIAMAAVNPQDSRQQWSLSY